MNSIKIYVSSLTGNTRKVAEYAADKLREKEYSVTLYNTPSVLSALHNSPKITDTMEISDTIEISDTMKISDFSASPTDSESPILLFFWCRKGGMDNHSLKLTEILHGRNILAVGTMGSYPDSPYGKLVYRNVEDQINQQNHCAGVFLSQGRIEESRTERRRSLPPDSPHYLDDEGYRRHLESRKHPDETDLENAWEFIYSKLIPDSCSSCCVIRSAPDI